MPPFLRTSRLQETERQGEKETVLEDNESGAMMRELLWWNVFYH